MSVPNLYFWAKHPKLTIIIFGFYLSVLIFFILFFIFHFSLIIGVGYAILICVVYEGLFYLIVLQFEDSIMYEDKELEDRKMNEYIDNELKKKS